MNVVEEYIRKLSSLPTTKYIAIREVNTRCPRNDITWGSGLYHNLHQMQRLWIPRLRRLHVTKKVNHIWCFGCKRFQAAAFQNPPPGNLPVEHTTSPVPFQVVCLDNSSPISNKASSKRETRKACILLFAEVFIKSLEQYIARRGRPQKVYSGDGRTFMTAARWLWGIMMDERMHDYLSRNHITWQFNLSRAPWWGGQFQGLAIVGLVKQVF